MSNFRKLNSTAIIRMDRMIEMKSEEKMPLCEKCGCPIDECKCVCPYCGESSGCECCVGTDAATGG
jgi:hypothetical protein